jgi:hypothetical protein
MSEESKSNGAPTDGQEDTLVLKLQRNPWQLTIDGRVENLNLVMAMLDEAKREIETQWRIARGMSAQQQARAQQEDAARVQGILDHVGRNLKRN